MAAKTHLLVLILLTLILPLRTNAETNGKFFNPLDTEVDLQQIRGRNFRLSEDKSLSGGKSGMLDSTMGPGETFAEFKLSDKPSAGVLTFWVYNLIDEPELLGGTQRFSFRINCTGEKDGKPASLPIEIIAKYTSDEWTIKLDTLGYTNSSRNIGVQFHPGWTRFDIVAPTGNGPRSFLVYIDGREAYRTPPNLLSFDALVFGTGKAYKLFFEDVSFDPNPDALRPAVVQGVQHSGTAGNPVWLKSGQTLDLSVLLDRRGARSDNGEVTLRLLNGLEQTQETLTIPIEWKNQQKDTLSVQLPAPKRSGSYWLQATYAEEGLSRPDVWQKMVDVQFLTAGFENSTTQNVRLSGDWDFLPTADKLGRTDNPPPAIPVPPAPPTDWSKAYKIKGPWLAAHAFIYPFWNAGWYHRKLTVPQSFQGKQIWLDIEDPHTIAYVFINGKNTGLSAEQPGATLDLTRWLKAGQTVDLDLFAVASPYFGMKGSRGPTRILRDLLGDRFQRSWFLWERGLMGPLTLSATSPGARIAGTAVGTSTKKKTLSADFELENLIPGKRYEIEAAVSAAGKSVLSLPKTSFTASSPTQTVSTRATWANPILWEMDAPYLYDLNAKLLTDNGAMADVMLPQRFGFREVAYEGRNLTLNGIPLTLFTDQRLLEKLDVNPGFAAAMQKSGYNLLQKDGDDGAYRIKNHDAFDEAGIAQRMDAGRIIGLGHPLLPGGDINNEAFWKETERARRYTIRKYRNHPSIFFWLGPMNVYHDIAYSPRMRDGETVPPLNTPMQKRENEVNLRSLALFREIDPYHLIDCRNSVSLDNICTTIYLNFTPIQEINEQNEYWVKYGTKPIFVEEDASPFQSDWLTAGGHNTNGTVPSIGENTARVLGQEAFVRDAIDEEVLKSFEDAAVNSRKEVEKITDPALRQTALEKWQANYPGANPTLEVYSRYPQNKRNDMWSDRLREYLRHWRADGVATYCGQFMEMGERLDATLREVQQPVTAFLAGTPEMRTSRNHIFSPGETLVRSALILNNSRRPVDVRCVWELQLNNKPVAGEEKTATVPPGGQISLPIRAPIPTGGDSRGELRMTLYRADSKEQLASDKTDIEVLAPTFNGPRGKVAVIDPIGDTVATLEKMGLKFQRLNFQADLSGYKTIVFGRNAFQYETAGGIDLGALTRAGKNILIMEQSENILRDRFRFRTEYASPRQVFIRTAESPLFEGLTDRTLRYWRGSSTLTDPQKESLEELAGTAPRKDQHRAILDNDGTLHRRPPKVSNTHNVATVVIIKPGTGNFRTLVDAEYALNYAAVLELSDARGRIIFNQLDVTSRTEADPAAQRFFRNLLRYAEDAPAPSWRKAVYLGGEQGKELLRFLRADFKAVTQPNEAPAGGVLVLGESSAEQLRAWGPALAAYVKAGGTILSLPKTEEQLSAGWLPFAVEARKTKINHSVVKETDAPLLAGLGNSDFYWQGNIDIVSLKKIAAPALLLESGVLAQVSHGAGQYVLSQADPSFFDLEQRPWLRQSRIGNERLLATLLTNLGVPLAPPQFLIKPGSGNRVVSVVDLAGKWTAYPNGSEAAPALNATGGQLVDLPGNFQSQLPRFASASGHIWFRRNFVLPQRPAGNTTYKLQVGQISGADWIFINGKPVGETTISTNPDHVGSTSREYEIDGAALKEGANEIAIHVYFDQNAQLGMSNTNGAISAPLEIVVSSDVGTSGPNLKPISLTGVWKGLATKMKENCPPANDSRWHDVKVPDQFDNPDAKGYPADWNGHNGYFWYRKTVTLDSPVPAAAHPVLFIGGVDDEDTAFVNGTPVGQTNKGNYHGTEWIGSVARQYAIPVQLLKQGANEITILNHDPENDGGIWKGPVEIRFGNPESKADQKLLASPYLHQAEEKDDPYRASWY